MGRGFHALYQQDPQPAESALFRREWFKIVDHLPADLDLVRFWDSAAKTSARNDYTAGVLLGVTDEGQWFIADVTRGRWEYPDARRMVLKTAVSDGDDVLIGIEDTSNGTAIVQDLLRDPAAAGLTIRAVKVLGDKLVRAGPWASLAQGGLVHLLRAEWNGRFLDECERFPLGAHDDQVDAVSGAHAMIAGMKRARFL